MTVRQLIDLLKNVEDGDLDCECVVPIPSPMPGIFAFEGVCPGVTEIIELGDVPEFVKDVDCLPQLPNQRVFLIAGHSFNDDEENQEDIHKKILN